MIRWALYPNFSPADFKAGDPDPDLLDMLQEARTEAGVPFVITSGYRPGDDGAHGRRLAVDIRCSESRPRFRILRGLILAGFNRIGIYDQHIHADCDPDLDQEVVWLGESQ